MPVSVHAILRAVRSLLVVFLLAVILVSATLPLPPEPESGILSKEESATIGVNETFLSADDFDRSLDEEQTFLTDADFLAAQRISMESPAQRKFLSRQLFHKGDIKGKASWRLKTRRSGARRNGVISGIKKWPNGRIPYSLSVKYNDRERAVLARSFSEYQKRTCVKFVPRTPLDSDYLYIGKIDGCYSDVGRAGGRQELSLDDGCLQYDTAIHELMHSVGFYHEHERWDRDEHITILWHNIDRDAYDQFGKVDLAESSYYGQAYDYYSVMHYDSLAFSKNGFETMVAKRPEMTKVIGSAIDFSPTDILKINLMYGCREQLAAVGIPTLTSGGGGVGGGGIPQPAIIPAVTNINPGAGSFVGQQASGTPFMPPLSSFGQMRIGNGPSAVVDPAVATLPGQAQLPLLPQVGIVPRTDLPAPQIGGVIKPSEQGGGETGEECRDKTNLCWRWMDRCRSYFFEKIMKDFCALSCGYCVPGQMLPPKAVARADPPPAMPLYRQVGRRR